MAARRKTNRRPTARLNAAQRKAVSTLSGPLLVLAGAGTGKTRVITHRIAALIDSGVDPARILAVTFTNKAAREMQERVGKLLGRRKPGAARPEISTFHSLCVRILRRRIERLGYPASFAIYDRNDQETLTRQALREVRVSHEKLRPGDFLAIVSGWKQHAIDPERALEVAATDKEQLASLAYGKYQSALRAVGAVDFDDLLLLTDEILRRFSKARRAEAARFDHILIDEYQDTNELQYRIVTRLAAGHRNLCVVGDDDQSIYGWRGAEVTHILSFKKDWTDATVVRLEENYRSRESILDTANRLIACNKQRHDKVLRASRTGGPPPRMFRYEDETEEAGAIVREIFDKSRATDHERVPPGAFAVLFRTNEQPRAFETELRRARIPYVLVGGQSFYDRKEIRDVLAYLKVLVRPTDEVALLRILNVPPRGIGQSSVKVLLESAVQAGVPLWGQLHRAAEIDGVTPSAAEHVASFCRLVEGFQQRLGTEPLAETAQRLLDVVGYRDELDRLYKNPGDVEARWASVEELVNGLALYQQRAAAASLAGFLEETALTGREDQTEEDDAKARNAVKLMTLHSAKGLEFPHVYMAGLEEGILPHERTVADTGGGGVAEERRLCYVGVTRAMDTLTLTFTKHRMKWGKARPTIPSRFLLEMRGEHDRASKAAEAAADRIAGTSQSAASVPATAKKRTRRSKPSKRAR